MKRLLLALVGFSAFGVIGCMGGTDPATNIGSIKAKLNLHGKADAGPAFSYFEYWQTAVPSLKSTTPTRNWPAGAEGSFGEWANGLRQGTSYSFRACGNDNGSPAQCVNTRSFTTGVSGVSGIVATSAGCGANYCLPSAIDPTWSPDATKIAYRGSNGKLWVFTVGGSSVQLGTQTVSQPDWSPDGTAIAASGQVINASDGSLRENWDPGGDPSWHPDGKRVAALCDISDEVHGICLMNATGNNQIQLTDSAQDFEPAFSPDGTKIAFRSGRGAGGAPCPSGCSVIWVMNADGTNETQLTFSPASGSLDRTPTWSPDGTQIAFSGLAGTSGDVVKKVNAAGGTPVELFGGREPDWSPRP